MENQFHRLASDSINEALGTIDGRGHEYGDTLGKLQTPFMDNTLREMGIDPMRLSTEQMKKLAMAAMCDVKLTRIATGRDATDSSLDLIPYVGAWRNLDATPRESIL